MRTSLSKASIALLFALTTTACASMKSRGDEAFARGDYRTAASFYEAAAREHPGDASIRKLLVESRVRVLRELAGKAWTEREAQRVETALPAIEDLLATQDQWKISGDEATGRRTVELVTWANATIDAEVSAILAKRWPLAAERVLAKRAMLLVRPHFAETNRSLRTKLQATGRASCDTAASKGVSDHPYFSRFAQKLCMHFGQQLADQPPLPLAASSVQVRYGVSGLVESERRAIDQAMLEGLQRSPYWEASSSRSARSRIDGVRSVDVVRRTIEMTRPWVETVPYRAVETYQEPYTVHYEDSESYTEQEPYTDYETRYRSCGNSTCTDSVPVTRYRSVQKTRPVTKSKTEYRTRERTVTKYRDVPRTFRFDAEEVTGSYSADLGVVFEPAEGLSFAFQLTPREQLRGIDHDVSFPAAGVSPSRSDLPTLEAWFGTQVAKISDEIAQTAHAGWRSRFCAEGAWSLESAARCAWSAGLDTPPKGKAVLAEGLGPEVDAVLSL